MNWLSLTAAIALAIPLPAQAGNDDHLEVVTGYALDLADHGLAQASYLADNPERPCALSIKGTGYGGEYIPIPFDDDGQSGERINALDVALGTAVCAPGVEHVAIRVSVEWHVAGRAWQTAWSQVCESPTDGPPFASSVVPPCRIYEITDLGDPPPPEWLGRCRRAKIELLEPAGLDAGLPSGLWGCASAYAAIVG